MPKAIPKIDFGSVQKAISDAFETYWRVKEGKRQSGENEKDRQAQMMRLQFGETAATERAKAGDIAAGQRQTAAIGSAEKMAGEQLGFDRDKAGWQRGIDYGKLGEEIRSNKAREALLWKEIDAKLADKNTSDATTMMIAAATEASKTISMAQQAYKDKNWAALSGMDEFNDRDVESLGKLQPQYALPMIIEKIQRYSIKKWEPIYKKDGNMLFDYPSYLKGLTPANIPQVNMDYSPDQGQKDTGIRLPTGEDIQDIKKGFQGVGERFRAIPNNIRNIFQ